MAIRVRHDQFSVIKDVMAHKIVNEFSNAFAEILRLIGELRQRLRQAGVGLYHLGGWLRSKL